MPREGLDGDRWDSPLGKGDVSYLLVDKKIHLWFYMLRSRLCSVKWRSRQLPGVGSDSQISRPARRPRSIGSSLRSRRALALLAAMVVGFTSSDALANAGTDTAESAITSMDPQQRVEALIRDWFAALADPAIDSNQLGIFLVEASFEYLSTDETRRGRNAFLASTSAHRALHANTEYRLNLIQIESAEPDLYRARFELSTSSLDEVGIAHVARREHTWMVQSRANQTPKILRIEDQPLLVYPGTGPQIVCY